MWSEKISSGPISNDVKATWYIVQGAKLADGRGFGRLLDQPPLHKMS